MTAFPVSLWGKLFFSFLAVAALTLILPAYIGPPLTVAVLAVFSLVLAGLFSYRTGKSVSGIVRMVDEISQGRFSRRLHAAPGTEFEPVAGAVNRMAQSIEDFVRAENDQRGQLEAILETMAEGVLVLGPKGRIRRANRTLAQHFPATAKALGNQVLEVIASPALQDAVTSLLADAEGFGRTVTLQIEIGDKIFSVFLARPHKEGAQALGAVAVFHDITELMRLESIRRDFVANVSHELRTPLTAVRGYAETLMDMEDLPEQARHFAEVIRKHGMALGVMVDDLLTLARLENASTAVRREIVNPLQALGAARHLLATQLEEARVGLTEDMTPDMPVLADAAGLEQVLRNLIENACRYAPPGSAIVVRAHPVEKEGLFSVSDHGPGIPSDDQARIFERFYRVEKHRGNTSGLGLAICKHIIERHGGRIWVESPAQDAATRFSFTLPLA